MKMQKLQELLNEGEGIIVEFKQSRGKLNRDDFESVCAFLNWNGGHLFLGVDDDGRHGTSKECRTIPKGFTKRKRRNYFSCLLVCF